MRVKFYLSFFISGEERNNETNGGGTKWKRDQKTGCIFF